jgi:hypothetical protein
MPRFVLLYHDCPPNYERPSHWDFMLESGDVLRTWALERLPRDWQSVHERTVATYSNCPSLATANNVAASQLGDHRHDYLQFEGPLSRDRGTVVRVASGSYHSESESSDLSRISLASSELSGCIVLARSGSDESCWTIEYQPTNQ